MQTAEAVLDSSTCINNLEKIVAGFEMADQLPVSDNHATVVRASGHPLTPRLGLPLISRIAGQPPVPRWRPHHAVRKESVVERSINGSIYVSRTQILMARQPRSSS